MKEMDYEEFKEKYVKNSELRLNDEGFAEMIKDLTYEQNGFEVMFICKKCHSNKIQIVGEDGIDYGELTGYSFGSNVIKCLNCGNAVIIYK